ncbi:glycine zipper domain-containing protein [Xanthobacter tagetidis]|jgi:hypothetical protein|uniref:Glycine zipper domain-containing protein n=1 Tax=Xanthobacter tagetidis TaxID=60216 RepID=A0A3L7AMU1_9HYPH|nr:glycine zipper domain-containing protein [Xanthobacter tagetidis]MBB6308144.1 uncharacterized protein YcfJ [Xanthobacter tagetidis]RLP81769.1 hypothetical protein D9R14_01875 [Xanthobacter tagetidis]
MTFRTAFIAASALLLASATAQAQNNTAAGAIFGGTAGALIGGAVTGTGGGAVAGALIGGTTGAILGAQADQQNQSYYFWANDGRCYLHRADGAILKASRSRCQ